MKTEAERRAYLRSLDEDTLWNTLCANTPGGIDASIMSTEEMIEYGVENWDDDKLRPATQIERDTALRVHGTTECEIDDNAQVAEGSEGMWVQA